MSRRWIYYLSLSTVLITATARSGELGPKDGLRTALYSSAFHLPEGGEPNVAVRILAAQESVRVTVERSSKIVLGGDGGRALVGPPGTTWTFELEDGHPGTRTYWVAAERFGADNPQRIEKAMARWTKRGLEPQLKPSGQALDLKELTVDTRLVTIAVGQARTRKGAEALARRLKRKHPISGAVFAEYAELPAGRVIVTHVGSGQWAVGSGQWAVGSGHVHSGMRMRRLPFWNIARG